MDKHASIWDRKQICLHMFVYHLSFFCCSQEALSKVISASLSENSNWQYLELLVEHIVAVFWIIHV